MPADVIIKLGIIRNDKSRLDDRNSLKHTVRTLKRQGLMST
jgi:hypothetical protein